MKEIISTCIYCGVGCKLKYFVDKNKIIKVEGLEEDEVSEGAPCIKGLTIHEVYNKNRITAPLINGKEVSLKKALKYVYEKTKDLSPNEVFFNTSGKITNEDNYVIQKFAKKCYETSNIDSCCGRICHVATLMAMKDCLGIDNITRLKYLDEIDCLLIIGSNPKATYPVFYNKLMSRKIDIIKVNSFLSDGLTIKPGSETALLNGIINALIKKGLKSKIEGFESLKKTVKKYDEDLVCTVCGINKKELNEIINKICKAKVLGVFHGMGLTQQVNSIENVHTLINLVLLKKGRILSLRGEINVQGAGDMKVPSRKAGFTKGMNIIEALAISPVKAAFIFEFNPAKSLPELKNVRDKLKEIFIIYFGSFWNETAKLADVVIPIASLLESKGTITNGEKRIRKVNKVLKGEAQAWRVLKELSKHFKKQEFFNYNTSREITLEIKRKVPGYKKINVKKLWEGSDEWPDKEIKCQKFVPEDFEGYDEQVDEKYPFILTTFRSKFSFLGNEVTKNSKTLKKAMEPPGFYLNPADAKKLKIKPGELIEVQSRIGKIKAKAYISNKIPKGIIGAYIHFFPINKIVPLRFDEESFTPNYKNIAVNVEKTSQPT